jgi:hypothetical protein
MADQRLLNFGVGVVVAGLAVTISYYAILLFTGMGRPVR